MKTNPASHLIIRLLMVGFILISFNSVLGQVNKSFKIEWESPREIYFDNQKTIAPSIAGQALDGVKPNFYYSEKYKGTTLSSLILEVIEYSNATKEDVQYLKSQYIEVGNLEYDLKIANANTDKWIVLNLFPFVKKDGVIKRISKFNVKSGAPIPPQNYIQKDFAANSVLRDGSGFWYKISVNSTGVYKIDKEFLENCGVDISTLNPQDINIYGNSQGRIPELNSLPRVDDLEKNAITIVGESDGTFDDGDYILFFGWSPHKWSQDGLSAFDQDRNPYSDKSCYFININSLDPPLRIASIASAPGVATHNVSSYSYYDVHELDLVSLVNGGQRWYGELFDTDLQKTISFNVPNIASSTPVNFEASLASNAKSQLGTLQRYSVGGTLLYDDSLPVGADYGRSVHSMTFSNPSDFIPITVTITRNSPDVRTYLDRILLNARRSLTFMGNGFGFRDLESVGVGNIASYIVTGVTEPTSFLWEVTDRHEPKLVQGNLVSNSFSFQSFSDSLREFYISDGVDFGIPQRIGEVSHQNLHGLDQADYLIVTNKAFISQANRLANLHRANGSSVHVVTTEQVFNEFSGGAMDASAIRMFAKMFYDRGIIAPETRPESLLLFGDGTFDPKGRVPNNNNYVLTYQVVDSENHISSLVTDDFFGLLDDNESINSSDLLDIGVGRLLISDIDMAIDQVNKVEHYMLNGSNLYDSENVTCNSSGSNSSTFGDWRTKYVQIADDEEGGYFIKNDVEPQFDTVSKYHPEMNCEKIYLDAYQQVTTAGGERYPDVNNAINDRINRGALVVNYVGHGGEVGVAEERVITVPQIQGWTNINNLPLIVSATCEFTKFDDPDRVSAGEWASINPLGGAIALMTTTRSVYFGVNTNTGKSFYENVFERDANFEPRRFGEIIKTTKNNVFGSNNKRSFTLIGDPHLRLALPRMNIVTDSINGMSPSIVEDTLRALSKVTIKGHMEDFNGSVLTGFNGVLYPSVYDKPKEQQTLQNDASSSLETFYIQNSRVYRGKASIVNGYFEFTFIVPKDINYSFDYGKISYYGENGITDGIGEEQRVYIGGVDPNGINDTEGPQIELFMNDENFANGGITDENPMLLAKVFDENGINAVGNGIGHDLTAIIDAETSNPIVLNEYYSADLDSYQSGEIRYDFVDLEPGNHTLTVKVWDVNNNSSEASLDFVVKEAEKMSLDHVLNYPNPFTTSTDFYFEHNQVCNSLETQIQIFTISGKLVKTINRTVHTDGFRSEPIQWNGLDDFGDQLAKGVYVYRLKVQTPEGNSDEKLEKLVILK